MGVTSNGYRVLCRSDGNVLELGSGDGLHNVVNTLKVTLKWLKWQTLYSVNISVIT